MDLLVSDPMVRSSQTANSVIDFNLILFPAEPSAIDNEKTGLDWILATEMEKYELGKRWLATMMGEDVETFTDEKINVSFT